MTDGNESKDVLRAQMPADIWEAAKRLSKLIDPDEILAEDPVPYIALALNLERQLGPGPDFMEGDT